MTFPLVTAGPEEGVVFDLNVFDIDPHELDPAMKGRDPTARHIQ